MLFSFAILFVASSTASAGATPAIGCQHVLAPPPCVVKPSQSVRPRGDPALWIPTSDYPTEDMRVGMQGTVAFRLERFSTVLNRKGFPRDGFSDSASVLVKEASMDGSAFIVGFACSASCGD